MSTDNIVDLPSPDRTLLDEARIATAIAAGIRAGSASAESDLVQRYSRGLRFLLARRVGDDELARDLLQDTFFIAIQKMRTIDLENPERLAGYLRGIAIRVASNARRKRQPSLMDADEVASLPDQEPRQFEQVSAAENTAAVLHLLDSMKVERDRELLRRFYIEDQDKEEICKVLDLSSTHFNRVLFRAKARFREILEESVDFDLPCSQMDH